jgi:hypothetical protein
MHNTDTTPSTDPAHLALEDFDATAPVFEVWVNGRRFACTQIPARAFRMLRDLHNGRPAHTPPELRVVNDRRLTTR